MQSKWGSYLSSVALVAGAAAACYVGETLAAGQASGWALLASVALAAAGKAVLAYVQKEPPVA